MHYPAWHQELGRPEIGPGGFGENFTVDGLDETTACVGDVYAVGNTRIQVTGPRYPCIKISRRWGIPTLKARVAKTGRTGWYCRVLQEGWVESGGNTWSSSERWVGSDRDALLSAQVSGDEVDTTFLVRLTGGRRETCQRCEPGGEESR